jgi:predicted transposase YdaD
MSRKPFDDAFKDLAEQDAAALLTLIGALPPGATVTPLPREVSVQALLPDQPYEVSVEGRKHVVHFEAQTYYDRELPYRIVDYDVRLWLKYRLPVYSYVLVFVADGMPPNAPESLAVDAGWLSVSARYRVVGLWQLSAADALAMGSESLLPFVPLMRGGEEELRRSAEALQAVADEVRRRELALHFVMVGSLRYPREDLFDILEEVKMLPIPHDLIRRSEMYQYILDEGRAEGLQRGREEGREEGRQEGRQEAEQEARQVMLDLLRRFAARRFPGLTLGAEVEQIRDLEAIEQVCLEMDEFADADALRRRLSELAAAQPDAEG